MISSSLLWVRLIEYSDSAQLWSVCFFPLSEGKRPSVSRRSSLTSSVVRSQLNGAAGGVGVT